MTELLFETVITDGDDRGSVRRVNAYRMDVPADGYSIFPDYLHATFYTAMEQAADDGFNGYDQWVSVETAEYFDEMTDETELMRLAWRSTDPDYKLVKGTTKAVVKRLVKDMLASKEWADGDFGFNTLEKHGGVDGVMKSIDWNAVWDVWKPKVAPAPVRIPVGTLVFSANIDFSPGEAYVAREYRGRTVEKTSFVSREGFFFGEEENFVPVDFLEAQNYAIEAFPLPQAFVSKRGRWFARAKNDVSVESITRLKKDAVHNVKVMLAVKDFWAE